MVNCAVQAAAPAAKATVDIDIDANIIKARQASLAFQVPVRTDGVQVQAAQGGQQGSIGLAAPVLMADASEAGTVADQIVKAIKIQVRDGIGEVRLRLQPEQMGEVHIALKVDRDRVSAVLQVERPELRAQMEGGQGQTLRAGLAAQGLQLEDLTVRPMLSDDLQGTASTSGSSSWRVTSRRGGTGETVEDSLALALWATRKGTLSAALAAGVAYASLVAMQFRGFRQFGDDRRPRHAAGVAGDLLADAAPAGVAGPRALRAQAAAEVALADLVRGAGRRRASCASSRWARRY